MFNSASLHLGATNLFFTKCTLENLTPHKYQHHSDKYPKYIEKPCFRLKKQTKQTKQQKNQNLDLLGCSLTHRSLKL